MSYLLSTSANSIKVNYKLTAITSLLVFQTMLPLPIQGEEDKDSLSVLFGKANQLCHAQKFEQSIEVALRIRELYPDNPAGVFSLLKNYQAIDGNYRVKLHENKIDSLLDIAIDLAEKALKKDKKNGRNYFYAGTAYGFKSLYSAQHNEWMEAFKAGTQITKNLNRAIALEPDFYDAYYGLGLNNYWLSAKGPMRYMPHAKHNRNEGIKQIRLVIEKGEHAKIDAMFGLAAIYIHEGEKERALEIYKELYQQFPQNPNISYRMGKIYEEQEKWQQALSSYKTLHDILESTKYKSNSYKVECLYGLAKCNYEMENLMEAKRLCQEALAIWPQVNFDKEMEGPYESFSEILNHVNNLSEELKDVNITQAAGAK